MPVYQEWGPLPLQTTTTKSINIAGAVPGYTETINIKDVVGLYPQYSQFKLHVLKQYVNPSYPEFIVPFGFTGLPDTDGFPPTTFFKRFPIVENGISLTFPIAFQNVGLLTPNVYRYKIIFSLQGLNSSTVWKEISYVTHETILKIVDDLVLFEPHNIVIDHIIGSALKTREVTLNGDIWNLKGNPKFILSSTDPGVYIEETIEPDGAYQTAFGNGTAVVKITLTPFFNIVGVEPYEYSYDGLVISSGGNPVNFVAVRVKKFSTQILSLSPEVISFEAIKNTTEAAAQNLLFECNVVYAITSSDWLTTVVDTVYIDGIPTQVIIVAPINSTNQETGIYTGFVSVTAMIEGIETTLTTIVNYEITDIAKFPYSTNELAFTLDNKFIELETFNSDTYMQMDTVIQAFDFYTNQVEEYTIREKIGLFKGKAKVNIGRTIHQILRKAKAVNENYLQYLPANVQVIFFENNLSDDTTIRIDGSGNLKFIAGLSNNFSSYGFLKMNHLPERVTVKSFKYLNFFIEPGLHYLNIYKNGSFLSTQELAPTNGKVATLKVFFEDYNQGDVVEFSINKFGFTREESTESSKIAFIVFPEGKHSNTVIWEDEFLLKQSVECTGSFSIKSNLSFISQKKYVDLVEQLSHLEISKVAKITINTGWLLSTDVDMIESLMRSKKVWINAKGKIIYLVPISDSITNTDSERELIDYTLEFQINPTYNEETYML